MGVFFCASGGFCAGGGLGSGGWGEKRLRGCAELSDRRGGFAQCFGAQEGLEKWFVGWRGQEWVEGKVRRQLFGEEGGSVLL